MRVLMISKACVVGAYQRKLEEMAALPGMELQVVVPPYWQEESRRIELEPLHTQGYRLEVEPIRFNGRFHLFYFPGLGGRIKSFRPDIVHIDEEPYNFASWHALQAAAGSGARSLFFTWQNLLRGYPPPFSWMEQSCLRRVDRAIAGNAEAVQVLRAKGFTRPVDVIPQFGVDPEIFRPLSREERPAAFRIGFVGRLVEQKGLSDLLEAVSPMGGDWQLVLVGAGPMREELEAKAEVLGIDHRLEILGGVPSREMPGIYNALDALVLPSRTRPNWKEQFGRALVEAMACGVPVVGSMSGEIPNVIGGAGLSFPEGEVVTLRHHLESLRDSSDLRRELAEKGRLRVQQCFTQASVARRTHEVYEAMLA